MSEQECGHDSHVTTSSGQQMGQMNRDGSGWEVCQASPVDRSRLTALAEAATSGPWSAADEHGLLGPDVTPAWCVSRMGDDTPKGRVWLYDIAYTTGTNEQADAEFIAACSPDVVLALLAELADREAERDQAERNFHEACSRLGERDAAIARERAAEVRASTAEAARDELTKSVQRDVDLLRGDIHHLVQPIIGGLRLLESPDHRELHEPHFWEYLSHTIERLFLVLNLMDEAATGEHADILKRGRHGVGNSHYPSLAAALVVGDEEPDSKKPLCATCGGKGHVQRQKPHHRPTNVPCPSCVAALVVGEPEQPTCEHDKTEPHMWTLTGEAGTGYKCPGPAADTPDEQ